MTNPKPPFPNPFDPNYVPQIAWGRPIKVKKPTLEKRPRFFRDNIAEDEKGKNFRLNKASI